MIRWVTVPALFAAVGCVGQAGSVNLVVETDSLNATRVHVTISPGPGDADLTQDATNPTKFTGSFTVATGTETITVQAFANVNGTEQLVGTGSATTTVAKTPPTNVVIKVLDVSGPIGGPDHGPVITALSTPSPLQAGDSGVVTVNAIDPDGNPLSYAWSSTCGTFANPAASSTSFTAGAVTGPCTVTITVTANGKTDTQSATIQILTATGTLGITVNYVPQPVISSFSFSTTPVTTVSRTGDGTTHATFHWVQPYTVTVTYDSYPTGTFTLTDSCGNTVTNVVFGASSSTATWTPATNSTLCNLTATLTRDTFSDGGLLSDSMFVVVLPVQ